MATQTLTLTTTDLLAPPAELTDLPHQMRLYRLTGNDAYWPTSSRTVKPELLGRLIERNYLWIVTSIFVKRFQYAASLGSYDDLWPVRVQGSNLTNNGVAYVGDIPDFALDRVEQAQHDGLRWFTIHSNEPLPVRIVEPSRDVMRKLEPAIVAWADMPYIEQGPRSFRANWQPGSNERAFCTMPDHDNRRKLWGVVVAAWDFDRELELAIAP